MMSIPTSNATATPPAAGSSPGAATGTEAGGSVATASSTAATQGGADGAGFTALIGSLLQGATAATDATAETVTNDASRADAGPGDEETAALLASLGLAPMPPTPAVAGGTSQQSSSESPQESSEREAQKAAALSAAAAALLGTSAPIANLAKTPIPTAQGAATSAETPVDSATRTALAAATVAPAIVAAKPADSGASSQALLAAAFAAVLGGDGESAAAPTESLEGLAPATGASAKASNDAGAGDQQGLNAWAAAAHRMSSAQDGTPRAALANADAQLRESVGSSRWKDELGARITLMATQGQQSGSLRLSPEHLGPLEIQITVNDDKTTNVQFGAQHAETRTALQDALPRLREMFAAAGLQLGDAGVSGQAPRQRPADESGLHGSGYDARSDGELAPLQRPVRSVTHSGLLDTYA